MKRIIFMLLLIGIVFVAGCVSQTQQTAKTGSVPSTEQQPKNTVEITMSGFSPDTLTINVGDTVTFVNKLSWASWPASAVHPTHTIYPGSDINKCGTEEQANIFDACTRLKPEEMWSFTFNQKGAWKYHDHMDPGSTGTIVVT